MELSQFVRLLESPQNYTRAQFLETHAGVQACVTTSLYAETLYAYLSGQTEILRRHVHKLETLSAEGRHEIEWVLLATRLRLAIRTHQADIKVLRSFERHLSNPEWNGLSALLGETHFILAMYFETFFAADDSEDRCISHYEKAYLHFTAASAGKKSVKSLHNAIAARTRKDPALRAIADYHKVVELARAAGDPVTEASALNNLSREFHLITSMRLALEYSQTAIDLLRKAAPDSLDFYFALLHRCHLHLEMGFKDKAQLDYEEARATRLPEIQEGLQVLHQWFDQNQQAVPPAPVSSAPASVPTWSERKAQGLSVKSGRSKETTELEGKLIQLLSRAPLDRVSIATAIWGESMDWEHADNRLKQLFIRVRKKYPDLLGYQHGKYFLLNHPSDCADRSCVSSR